MKKIIFTASEEYKALLGKANMLDSIMAKVAQEQGIEVSAVTMEMLSDYFEAISNQQGDDVETQLTASLQTQIDTLSRDAAGHVSTIAALHTEIANLKTDLKTKNDRIAELEKIAGADAVVPVPEGDANAKGSDDPYLAIANDATMSEIDRIAALRKLRNQ